MGDDISGTSILFIRGHMDSRVIFEIGHSTVYRIGKANRRYSYLLWGLINESSVPMLTSWCVTRDIKLNSMCKLDSPRKYEYSEYKIQYICADYCQKYLNTSVFA